jgi:hypothetical protein
MCVYGKGVPCKMALRAGACAPLCGQPCRRNRHAPARPIVQTHPRVTARRQAVPPTPPQHHHHHAPAHTQMCTDTRRHTDVHRHAQKHRLSVRPNHHSTCTHPSLHVGVYGSGIAPACIGPSFFASLSLSHSHTHSLFRDHTAMSSLKRRHCSELTPSVRAPWLRADRCRPPKMAAIGDASATVCSHTRL